jgi:hypothetical protein
MRCTVRGLRVPNRTRWALFPVIGTTACSPRSAHARRNTGNRRRMVSSSKSHTASGGRCFHKILLSTHLAEVQERETAIVPQRVRRCGGGRQPLTAKDPMLVKALNALVEPTTRGDPESSLRWTCKSTTRLAQELEHAGHPISQRSVCTCSMPSSIVYKPIVKRGKEHASRPRCTVSVYQY